MNTIFPESFCFSYLLANYREITAILKTEFKKELEGKAAQLEEISAEAGQFISYKDWRPEHYKTYEEDKAIFYQPRGLERGVIMISNVDDGWKGLQRRISGNLKCEAYQFRLENLSLSEPMNMLSYSFPSKEIERVVYSVKEGDKWTFCSVGPLLPFEKEEYYQNRMIKKRMDPTILTEYLRQLGLPTSEKAFFEVENGTRMILFKRKDPNPYMSNTVSSNNFYTSLKFADETPKQKK